MNDLQELSTQEIQDLEKKQFEQSLNKIFSETYSLSKLEFEEGKLIKAKVSTNETLDVIQLIRLTDHSDVWGLTYQISRSGAGMKIEFKENQE